MIADDEPDILEIVGYNLEKEGYEVITAQDGQQALEMTKAHKPDLVILDIMMPYKSGIEVCHILRSSPEFNETLIVMLKALNDEAVTRDNCWGVKFLVVNISHNHFYKRMILVKVHEIEFFCLGITNQTYNQHL